VSSREEAVDYYAILGSGESAHDFSVAISGFAAGCEARLCLAAD